MSGAKFNCDLCVEIQKDQNDKHCEGYEKAGYCVKGKIPSLNKENVEVWEMFMLMLPGLIKPDGYDYSAIPPVLNAYNVPPGNKKLINQIVGLIRIHRSTRDEG